MILSTDENEEWFERLVDLTENAYESNDKTPVTFIVHSLGGEFLQHFFTNFSVNLGKKSVKNLFQVKCFCIFCNKCQTSGKINM